MWIEGSQTDMITKVLGVKFGCPKELFHMTSRRWSIVHERTRTETLVRDTSLCMVILAIWHEADVPVVKFHPIECGLENVGPEERH